MIKKLLSDRQLEKFVRAKQYVHDADVFKGNYKILPPLRHRIGDEVVTVSPVSDITIAGWRNLLKLFDRSSDSEKAEFKESVQAMILSDTMSIVMLETKYIWNIFSNHQNLYL